MRPKWDADGQPANIAAAAEDALEWMQIARNYVQRNQDLRERVDRAMDALRKHAKLPVRASAEP